MDTTPNSDRSNYFRENRKHWEEILQQSSATESVSRIEEFLTGETALLPIEEEELGNIDGTNLLDLQCFVGIRTLSWARKGATVTGVDMSTEAINASRKIAAEAGLEDQASFIEANVYDLPEIHSERYDVVFTNFGVLCWLPDIELWAEVVAEFLKPGGIFYLAEYHPISDALSYDFTDEEAPITIENPYFLTEEPVTPEAEGPFKWTHSLGETLTALIDAGIELKFVHEHPFSVIEHSPGMIEDENGYWRFENDVDLPQLVTIKGKMKHQE